MRVVDLERRERSERPVGAGRGSAAVNGKAGYWKWALEGRVQGAQLFRATSA